MLFQGLAPAVGGALTGELSWRWIFWAQAIVAAAVPLIVLRATSESRDPDAERRVDALGIGLLAGALGAVSLAFIQAPAWGWTSPPTIALFVSAVVLGAGFVAAERRSPAPLVNLGLFRRRNFTGATVVLFVVNFALIVGLFFLPLLLQEQLEYSPTEAGVLLAPLVGAMLVTLPLGGPAAERVGPLPPIGLGLGAMTVGYVLMSMTDRSEGYVGLVLPMILVGAGAGLSLTPMNMAAMNAVHSREAGAAGGLFLTLSGIGIGLGVAISGAVFNSRQLSATEELATDAGVTLTGDEARALDGLLAGASDAQAALRALPAADRDAVEEAVRGAFDAALDSAFRVGVAVTLAGLALALVLLRRRPAVDEPA